MSAEIVTALCLLYLDKTSAVPFSSKSTKLTIETNFPVLSERTNIFDKSSLFLLSDKYCCKIIGYSLPSLLKVVTLFPHKAFLKFFL